MSVADYFIKMDGIEGESYDHKHKGEIEVLSWSWGETNSGTHASGGGGGAGKVNMQDFHFVMHANKATPKLFLACASGEHIKKAVLVCRKAGKDQHEYLKIVMSDFLVSSYQIGGSGGSSIIPMDQVTLNFSKFEIEYKEQKPDGTLGGAVTAGWNVKEGKKVG